MTKKTYRNFNDAKKYVQSLKFNSITEWRIYCRAGKKPDDIPAYPESVYKKEWKGWGDFLGTGTVASYNKEFETFEKAKKFVQSLGIKNQGDWRKFAKSGKLKDGIPRDPPTVYKKEWKGWPDWLRDSKKLVRISNFESFEDARKYVHKLKINGQSEWQKKYVKSGKKPEKIPASPQAVYKKEWKGWGDWLGTGNVHKKNFLPMKEAKKFVHKLKLKSYIEWTEYRKSSKRPINIPSMPERVYKKEWKGYGDFLGTGRGSKLIFSSFDDARKYARSLELKTREEWTKLKNPDGIPKNPPTVYKKEWKGWGDFLGTGRIANQNMEYQSFEKVRQFTQKLNLKSRREWEKFCKSKKRTKDIPRNPERVYKKEWKGWGDFLGTGRIANMNMEYLPTKEAKIEARKIAKKLGFVAGKGVEKQWNDAWKAGKIPKNLPSNLRGHYDPNSPQSKRRRTTKEKRRKNK